MAEQNTSAMVLSMGTDDPIPAATAETDYVAIGGVVTAPFSIDSAEVDVTDKASGSHMEVADGLGLNSISLSVDGILKDDATFRLFERAAFGEAATGGGTFTGTSSVLRNFQVNRPGTAAEGGGTYRFKAKITSFAYGDPGPAQAITFSATLKVSGIPVWTSA